MFRVFRSSIGAALLALSVSTVLFAQPNTGTIAGVVKDSSGGVLPGASVKIVVDGSSTPNFSVDLVATGDGSYRTEPLPAGAYFNPGTGVVHNAFTEAEAFGPYQPPDSLEAVKRRAAQLNANGSIAHKFEMKVLVHNHRASSRN